MPAKKKNKKTSKKRAGSKAAARKKQSARKKRLVAKTRKAARKAPRKASPSPGRTLLRQSIQERSGQQSGDLQAISRRQGADSESVEELLEEGNVFEANAVTGVEAAEDADEREVRTHEVPEDDVPGEYLDKDA
jgi:N utilization substance protein A